MDGSRKIQQRTPKAQLLEHEQLGGLCKAKQNSLAKIGASDMSYSLDTDAAGVSKAVAELKPLLQGKVIEVQTSTTQVQFLEKYFAGVVEVREYKTTDASVLDLASGRIDATLDGAGFLGGVIASPQGKDLELVGPRFGGGLFGGDSCIALRKADTDLKVGLGQRSVIFVAKNIQRYPKIAIARIIRYPASKKRRGCRHGTCRP
ncbi:transporter substrate-binding domain-containing protein [Mesorhizobium sp.]|uniref:transporter substrate-binding domain-containing protein n=1 Tax=Mesorhizobium sp. TaxID=1871066 RepID=UPI000FE6156D|nr:transporter substrate-binding domain-containing protein [Mesorhizobium sp.]RWC33522.1 MAG: transporter substrate-binding domain-containing protein [Mesorhizobium sp.]TIX28345.1 MAG: transporter substrate-binding domain-containing protein [Mesorhizobium sp.]